MVIKTSVCLHGRRGRGQFGQRWLLWVRLRCSRNAVVARRWFYCLDINETAFEHDDVTSRNRFLTCYLSYVYVYENKWRIKGIFLRNLTESRPKPKPNVENVVGNCAECAGECCNESRAKVNIDECLTGYWLEADFFYRNPISPKPKPISYSLL